MYLLLIYRYGEDAASALKNPHWHCPVCRGICNCSFCRAKAGKRPTGVLTPIALKSGHKSVKEFLDSLGKCDILLFFNIFFRNLIYLKLLMTNLSMMSFN